MKHYWTAEPIWPDSTIVCIAGGPSLTKEQVDYCRDKRDANGYRVRVIVVNNSYLLAPWADILYFCDCRWWKQFGHGARLADWKGMIVRLQGGEHDFGDPRVKVMRNMDEKGGLADKRDGLHTGQNSGYQVINLAVHLGAKRILLLGYDMDVKVVDRKVKTHWHGGHPDRTSPSVYDMMLRWFDTLPAPLAKRGVEVVNCTGGGRLKVFPRRSIQEALPEQVAV